MNKANKDYRTIFFNFMIFALFSSFFGIFGKLFIVSMGFGALYVLIKGKTEEQDIYFYSFLPYGLAFKFVMDIIIEISNIINKKENEEHEN